MASHLGRICGVVVATLFVTAACVDAPPGLENADAGSDRIDNTLGQASIPRPLDDEFLRIANSAPSFAGLSVDETGRFVVYLANLGDANVAKAAIQSVLHESRAVRFEKVEFGFRELNAWRDRARGLLAIPGVLLLDVDELRNRLRIGVVDADAAALVETELRVTGIPRKAVVVEQAEPFRFVATLRDRVRPTVAGLQIGTLNFFCTLSANGGNGYQITNSHCTDVQGGVENTFFYQAQAGNESDHVSTEITDPTYITGFTCPVNRRCRRSDAALLEKVSPYDSVNHPGRIALTTERNPTAGSLNLVTTNPRDAIYIDGVWGYSTWFGGVYVGQELDKVGRTTGWTFGPVSSTCVDINVGNSDVTLWCQTIVNGGVGPGDSGSPVFVHRPIGTSHFAELVGVLWGGNSLPQFAFSPFPSVLSELNAPSSGWCEC